MGPFVAELREFIRRLRLAEDDQRSLKLRAAALEQAMRDAWAEAGSGGVTLTDFGIECDGCLSGAFSGVGTFTTPPGAVFTITDHSTGSPVATLAAAGGTQYATQGISAGPTLDWDIVATSPSARLIAPAAYHLTLPGGGTIHTGIGGNFTPAAGYHCGGRCDLPLSDALKLDDTSRGIVGQSCPFTLTFPPTWRATVNPNLVYSFRPTATDNTLLSINDGANTYFYDDSALSSFTCPSNDGTTKFSATITVAGGTVRIYEP